MSIRFTLIIIAALTTLLLGCSSTKTYWEKSGASPNDFDMDFAQCNAQALSVPGITLGGLALIQNQCLRGKGWYQVNR